MISFRDRIAQFVHPFAEIAKELRIIRELYEAELSERYILQRDGDRLAPAPIRRVTEKPSRHDTEVTYAGDNPKPDFFGPWDDEADETRI